MKIFETYFLDDGETAKVFTTEASAQQHVDHCAPFKDGKPWVGIKEVEASKLPPQKVWVHRSKEVCSIGDPGRAYTRKITHMLKAGDTIHGMITVNGQAYKVVEGWVWGYRSTNSYNWYTLYPMDEEEAQEWIDRVAQGDQEEQAPADFHPGKLNGYDRYLAYQYSESGNFFKGLFAAITYADTKNTAKLALGFPEEVDAYKIWSTVGAREFLDKCTPGNPNIKKMEGEI